MNIRYIWYRLKEIPRNIMWWFINIWTMRKALWEARPWDYHGLLSYNREQLKSMIHCIDNYGCHVGKEECVKQMKVCVALIDRIQEEDYGKWSIDNIEWESLDNGYYKMVKINQTNKYPFPVKDSKKWSVQEMNQKKIDMEMLCQYYRKHTFRWWN